MGPLTEDDLDQLWVVYADPAVYPTTYAVVDRLIAEVKRLRESNDLLRSAPTT